MFLFQIGTLVALQASAVNVWSDTRIFTVVPASSSVQDNLKSSSWYISAYIENFGTLINSLLEQPEWEPLKEKVFT